MSTHNRFNREIKKLSLGYHHISSNTHIIFSSEDEQFWCVFCDNQTVNSRRLSIKRHVVFEN